MTMKIKSKKVGPGGIRCSCCRPVGSVQESKRYLRRFDRRVAKQELKAIISGGRDGF